MKNDDAFVTEYIKTFPENIQSILKQIRNIIIKNAPNAIESMSYGMPAYKTFGKPLVYFAGYKNHVSLYPAPRGNEAFEKELSVYRGGKGTVQFPLDKPLPLALIKKMVKFRMKENIEKEKSKPIKKEKLAY